MSKKTIFPKHIKVILTLLLTCLITITLTGCDSSNRKPTGGINTNDTYAENGDVKLTVGELYDELRYYASDYVIDTVYEFIYEDEIKTVSENPSKYKEKFDETILNEIYGTSEQDEIDELDPEEKNKSVKKYVDNMYKVGYVISEDAVKNNEFETVYSHYYLEVAKYVAAWNKLAEEFKVNEDGSIDFGNINEDSYFTEEEVISWYDSKHKNTGYLDAILIRFVNSKEYSNLLKKFGIKISNGKWYQIPLSSETESKPWETESGYDKYYDEYVINPSTDGSTPIEKLANGKATIVKIFAEMYNYIYTYRTPIVLDETLKVSDFEADKHLQYYNFVQALIKKDNLAKPLEAEAQAEHEKNELNALEEKLLAYDKVNDEYKTEYIHMSKDRIDKYSSSLSTYLYNTLQTEAKDDEKQFTQYTTNAKSYGNYYYLAFKLGQEADVELYEEVTVEDDEKEKKLLDTPEAKELLQTILLEMFEEELDHDYIHEVTHERLEDVELKIFDSAIELQFMYMSQDELVEHYTKTRKSSNNEIAAVKYKGKSKQITVSDAYAYLEPLYGPQLASTLFFDKYIVNTKYYEELTKNEDKYVENIEMMLYYFANDYYSQSGYPSSIGKYNFMKLYFRTSNVDQAVKTFMISDARNAFITDFAAHFAENEDKLDEGLNKFYENLEKFVEEAYGKFYSLTATGVEVYIDIDEDGEKDNLNELQIEKADGTTTADSVAEELLQVVYNEIASSKDNLATALTNVVNEYNDSSRIFNANPTTPENKWAQYRRYGLHLETTSIGTVTNSTTTADKFIQEKIKDLYFDEELNLVDDKLGFTSPYLHNEVLINDEKPTSATMLLITAGALPTSAKYEASEETPDLYKNISVIMNDKMTQLELSYETDKVNRNQIMVYVSEYVMFNAVHSLPASTTTALETFVAPFITKYTSNASQLTIIGNVLGEIEYKNNDAAVKSTFNDAFIKGYTRSAFYNNYLSIMQASADGYEEETSSLEWWNMMYTAKGGNQ